MWDFLGSPVVKAPHFHCQKPIYSQRKEERKYTHANQVLPESSSSSQGISLKGWAVLVGDDAASDSKYGTICLFQGLGSLLYFDKSIRSEVWHFQFSPPRFIVSRNHCCPTEFLLQRFSQNQVYYLLSTSSYVSLWSHCNWCLCVGCTPHSSVYFLSF